MKFPNVSKRLQFCICAIALCAVAYGQNSPTQSPTTPSSNKRATSDTTGSFTTRAMEVNSAEIQLGQLAEKNSQNDKVKSFAQMMVKDHTGALAKFQGAAGGSAPRSDTGVKKDEGVSATPTNLPALNKEHQQLMSRLQKKNGASFDRDYINAMVTGHREALRMFELEAGGSASPKDTKALAVEMLPTVRHHLKDAEDIQKTLK